MNAKLITRLSVFAIAGAALAGCSTEQAANTAVGATGAAATGAAIGAIADGGAGAAVGAGIGGVVGAVGGALWNDIKDLFGAGSNTAGTKVSQQQDGSAKVTLSGDAAFAPNSAQLLPGNNASLDKIVTYLKAHPNATLQAIGFTDSTGSARLNQALSLKRAQSVLDYLSINGVRTNQLLPAQGYGEKNPVGNNETVAGRAANRRVELYVRANGSAAQPPSASEE